MAQQRKSRSRSSSSSSSSKSGSEHDSHMTQNHDEIRQWAEERGGKPACVKGTESGNSCLLRIDFPGGAGAESLSEMSWDDFFNVLDQRGLVFLYQKGKSTFNKIVTPDTIEEREKKSHGRR